MGTRYDRDIDTRREDRGGWQQMHGEFGRIQSREDMRDFRPRDWRHDDRFGSREDEQQYSGRRFRDEGDRDEDRGWFDRVRDTASRFFRGRDEDAEQDEEDNRRRFGSRSWQDEDDRRQRFGARGWQDEEERGRRFGARGGRDEDESRRRFGSRNWQDDENRGRMRDDEDYRRRQFVSYRPEDDDRSGQFERMRSERGTLGRRGESGLTGRSQYGDRGMYDRDRFQGEEDRFGSRSRFDERRREFAGDRRFGREDRDQYGRQFGRYGEYGEQDRGEQPYGRGEPQYGRGEQQYGRGEQQYGRGEQQYGRGEQPYGRGEQPYGRGEQPYGRGEQQYGGRQYGEWRERGDERQRYGRSGDGRDQRYRGQLDRDEYGRFGRHEGERNR